MTSTSDLDQMTAGMVERLGLLLPVKPLTYRITMTHGPDNVILEAKSLEIAYCLIGEHVVRGWTFKTLELP